MESKIIALILCGISVVLGVALYKIGKKDSFSLAPFCGALTCVAAALAAVAILVAA